MEERKTTKELILERLASGELVPGYKLEKVRVGSGWIGTSGLRRCRELVKEGLIEKEYRAVTKKCVRRIPRTDMVAVLLSKIGVGLYDRKVIETKINYVFYRRGK